MTDTPQVGRVRVYRDAASEWRWTAHARNGEPVADSAEGYETFAHARHQATELFPDAELDVVEAFVDTPGDPAAVDRPATGLVAGFATQAGRTDAADAEAAEAALPPDGAGSDDEPPEADGGPETP